MKKYNPFAVVPNNRIRATQQHTRLTVQRLALCLILFNLAGMANAQQTAGDYKTAWRYDMGGQLTGEIGPDPDGISGPLGFPATRYSYNDQGQVILAEHGELADWMDETVIPNDWEDQTLFTIHSIRVTSYDEYGRKVTAALQNKNTGATETLTQLSYDSQSRVQCQTVRMNPVVYGSLPSSACSLGTEGQNGPDRITRFTYNKYDQVVTEERAVGTPLEQVYVRNVYDDNLLRYQTDANGNRTELHFNDNKLLWKQVYPSKTTAGAVNESDFKEFRYDVVGFLEWERKRNGTIITYRPDANNRITKKDLPGTVNDVNYAYDLRGLTKHSLFGSGEGVTNTFDGFGRLLSARTHMEGSNRTLNYQYDPNGNRTHITHPDNVYFEYGFDQLNRVDEIEEGGNPMLWVNYQANGRRTSIQRNAARSGALTQYNYDGINRLLNFTQNLAGTTFDITNSFGYTPASQLATITHSNAQYHYAGNANRTGDYQVNGLNQYTTVNGSTLIYDANGNLTQDGTIQYLYDDENRLIQITGSQSASFRYDPLGRLFRVTINGSSRQFLYDGDALVAEYTHSSTSAPTNRYVHGDQVDEPLVQYNGSNVGTSYRRFLHADHQGSIIAHSNNSGSMQAINTYDTYGLPGAGNTGRFAYTGQIWFKELGLYHYKARIYSPTLGRFLQTDPIGYDDQMNLYAYVGNDPVNMVDPLGLKGCEESTAASCTEFEHIYFEPESTADTVLTGDDARRYVNNAQNIQERQAHSNYEISRIRMLFHQARNSGPVGELARTELAKLRNGGKLPMGPQGQALVQEYVKGYALIVSTLAAGPGAKVATTAGEQVMVRGTAFMLDPKGGFFKGFAVGYAKGSFASGAPVEIPDVNRAFNFGATMGEFTGGVVAPVMRAVVGSP